MSRPCRAPCIRQMALPPWPDGVICHRILQTLSGVRSQVVKGPRGHKGPARLTSRVPCAPALHRLGEASPAQVSGVLHHQPSQYLLPVNVRRWQTPAMVVLCIMEASCRHRRTIHPSALLPLPTAVRLNSRLLLSKFPLGQVKPQTGRA